MSLASKNTPNQSFKDSSFTENIQVKSLFNLNDLRRDTEEKIKASSTNDIESVLFKIIASAEPISFSKIVYPESVGVKICLKDKPEKERRTLLSNYKVKYREKLVVIIDHLHSTAKKLGWDFMKRDATIYIYNGSYWEIMEAERLKDFLVKFSIKVGFKPYQAKQFIVRDQLFQQFLASGFKFIPDKGGEILINLSNGTFVMGEYPRLRPFNSKDYLFYCLPFKYDPMVTAPLFNDFLNKVLPDKSSQQVLAEFIAYLFCPQLKLEKALILYGSGANGKSVFFDIIQALLGEENITNFSVSNLCDDKGYYRAKLENKLLNYSSEMGVKLDVDLFKQLCSGEPVNARLPYGNPFQIKEYARFIFNTNTLPRDIEHSPAFYRRFLIIPFNVTIPKDKQDIHLAQKIITSELSGVFNWVLEGLSRLLKNNCFTFSYLIEEEINRYRIESDSVALFMAELKYTKDPEHLTFLKKLYQEYKGYCYENGYSACSNRRIRERLHNLGYLSKRIDKGVVIYCKKKIV